MRLIATPIPRGSHGVRVWRDLSPGDDLPENKDPYSFACNLLHIDDDTCELAQAMGDLNNSILIAIGIKAVGLGYTKMVFCRPKGSQGTRWATFVRSEDNLDYYEVDLNKALERYDRYRARITK